MGLYDAIGPHFQCQKRTAKLSFWTVWGGVLMSEETKAFFLESVKSASLLWCNKAISSDDFFTILKRTVSETEKRMKIDPESWTV